MEYGKLGNTDIEVSKLCVGCMSFGKAGTMHNWTLDEAESENVIKHALDLGYNFFDTANGYSAGTSEEYLGKALKKNVARNQVVIASKVYFNEGRLSRQAIMREIDGTLSRLGTDYLDLYIIHRFDYDTPIEETMEALHDLGDENNLTLDPSADSYYLIDNVTRRMPDVSERLGRLRAMGTGVLASKAIDEQRHFDISSQLGELNMALSDFNENLKRAAEANPAVKPSLDRLGQDFNEVLAGLGPVASQREPAIGRCLLSACGSGNT